MTSLLIIFIREVSYNVSLTWRKVEEEGKTVGWFKCHAAARERRREVRGKDEGWREEKYAAGERIWMLPMEGGKERKYCKRRKSRKMGIEKEKKRIRIRRRWNRMKKSKTTTTNTKKEKAMTSEKKEEGKSVKGWGVRRGRKRRRRSMDGKEND